MKKSILFIFLTLGLSLSAQLTITDPGSNEPLNGSEYFVGQEPQAEEHEHALHLTNESDLTFNVGCRRIELDVVSGTDMQSTLCWVICPQYIPVGSQEIRTSDFTSQMDPGEIDSSFVMHLRTFGFDGCSSYRIEWFDADNDSEVFATMDIIFDHSSGACATSVEDLDYSELIKLLPNPASKIARLSIQDIDNALTVQVYDILGQEIWTERLGIGQNRLDIPVSSFNNGIYFVSLSDPKGILHTERLVVNH